MSIKDEVKEIFSMYKEDENERMFDIFHLYPGKPTGKKGIKCYRFFKVIGFNRTKMTKKELGTCDEMRPWDKSDHPTQIGIFMDGSMIIAYSRPKTCRVGATLWIDY